MTLTGMTPIAYSILMLSLSGFSVKSMVKHYHTREGGN